MTMKIEATASISPDRGDDRIGVNVQIKNQKVWLTRPEVSDLIRKATEALKNADRMVRVNEL
jgi:uncharacterized protein YabE (DUF348 family)